MLREYMGLSTVVPIHFSLAIPDGAYLSAK